MSAVIYKYRVKRDMTTADGLALRIKMEPMTFDTYKQATEYARANRFTFYKVDLQGCFKCDHCSKIVLPEEAKYIYTGASTAGSIIACPLCHATFNIWRKHVKKGK